MVHDAKDYMNKCKGCKKHEDIHISPTSELNTLNTPWSFS